jgi:hypothetical protein
LINWTALADGGAPADQATLEDRGDAMDGATGTDCVSVAGADGLNVAIATE